MRLQCPKCTTEFDLRPPSGGRKRSRVQFRCTECGTPLGLEELHLEDDEDAPSEMPSVAGMVPDLLEPGSPPEPPVGDLPFDPPTDPVVERFQAEMASLGQESEGGGDGALLKQDGKVYHVRNTATIQRWVVERRVLREDLISTGGMRWEPVGGHPDLEIFFQMVERLDALEQTGTPPEHNTAPPVADQGAEPWAENSDPGLPMPEEDDEEPLSDLPSEPEITGPVYISEEDDDQDSEISAIPFAIKSTPKPPASVSMAAFQHGDGLPEMRPEPVPLGEADPETAESPAAETVVMGAAPPPLPVSTGPIDESTQEAEFDEAGFFAQEPDPDPTVAGPVGMHRPPPVPAEVEDRTLALPIIEDKDGLAWEEDRRERRQRMAIIGGVVLIALLALGAWWVTQQPEPGGDAPLLAEGTQPDGPAEGEDPGEVGPEASGDPQPTPEDPSADPDAKDPPAGEDKPAEKPLETKPAEKPAETKPAEKPAETKPANTKPAETKPANTKPKDPPRERKPRVVDTDAGWTAMGSGDFNGARLIFVEAVAANPRNADAHYGLGYAAQKQGDQATAIRHYCKALDLGPGNREIQQTVPSLLSSMDAACP